MRKFVIGGAILAVVAAGFPNRPSVAQTSLAALRAEPADKTAQIQSAIKAFPNGGPALRAHIADLVIRDPDMASALARQLLSPNDMTEAQKVAVEGGLADALNRLGIVAQAQLGPGGLSPLLMGTLAVGGLIGLGAVLISSKGGN